MRCRHLPSDSSRSGSTETLGVPKNATEIRKRGAESWSGAVCSDGAGAELGCVLVCGGVSPALGPDACSYRAGVALGAIFARLAVNIECSGGFLERRLERSPLALPSVSRARETRTAATDNGGHRHDRAATG